MRKAEKSVGKLLWTLTTVFCTAKSWVELSHERIMGFARRKQADLGTNPPEPRGFVFPQIRGATWSSNYVPFRIAKSDWLPVLKDLGYGDYFLIEVPLRGVPERSELKKALSHLSNAWDHFNLGSDPETVAACRKMFERLALDHGAEKPDQNAWEKILKGVNGQKREKLKHLLHRFCDFLNLGPHDPREGDHVELDRSDAEYTLILAQATLAYLARLWISRRPAANQSSNKKNNTPARETSRGLIDCAILTSYARHSQTAHC